MSITIISQEELEQQATCSIIRQIPLLFYPVPQTLYNNRMKRFKTLAQDNPLSDYLTFCAAITEQQAHLIKQYPLAIDLSLTLNRTIPPLSLSNYPLTDQWQYYLTKLVADFPDNTQQISSVIKKLKQNSKTQLQEKAQYLLQGEFEKVDSNETLFIWSALSLYYAQLASKIKGKAIAENTDKHWLCPVCNSLPVASVIHFGNNSGARYLHCSLCESEWYVPRVKCTSCDNMKNIEYYSLDEELSATKTECCSACHSYLKIFDKDKNPHIDVVADDIDSSILDMKTEEEGFAKSGLNPLLFFV